MPYYLDQRNGKKKKDNKNVKQFQGLYPLTQIFWPAIIYFFFFSFFQQVTQIENFVYIERSNPRITTNRF